MLLQTKWASILNPIVDNQLVKGTNSSNIALGTVQTAVPHHLSRLPQGYLISRLNANSVIYESAPADTNYLYLTASAACTADLYIY